VLRAVNLGDDADTTGAIYGQLAGAFTASKGSHRTGSSGWQCAKFIGETADALFVFFDGR
jgi:ADP-ribosyl-[dinitrogen reductase] hydrolase